MKRRLTILTVIAAITALCWALRPRTSTSDETRTDHAGRVMKVTREVRRSRWLNIPEFERRQFSTSDGQRFDTSGPVDDEGQPHGQWRIRVYRDDKLTEVNIEDWEHGRITREARPAGDG